MQQTIVDTPPVSEHRQPIRAGSAPDVSRRTLALLLAAAALLPPVLGIDGIGSGLALLLFGGLLASALASPASRTGRLPVLGWLPAGLVLALLCVAMAGLAAAALDVRAWGDRSTSLLTWGGLIAAVLTAASARGGRVRLSDGRATVLVTALPLAAMASALATRPFEVWARIVAQGTDFARHALIVTQTADAGMLDYAADAYPRSAHAALALLQTAAGDASYVGAWQSTQALLLTMYALLGTATALLAGRVARAIGAPATLSAVVALVLALVGPWTIGLLSGGFLTSVQAAVIIAAGALLVWDGRSWPSAPAVITLILLCSSMAHAWLLVLPVIAAPTAVMALPLLLRRRAAGPLWAAAALGIVAAGPVLWASINLLGVSATNAGGASGLPFPGPLWLGLFLLAGCGTWALNRARATAPTRAMLALLAALVVSLLLLAVTADGGEWGLYYLIKTAWAPVAVLLGLAVPAALRVLASTRGRAATAAVVLVAAMAAAATAGAALHAGRVLARGSVDAPLVIPLLTDLQLRYPDRASRPEVVVWGLTPFVENSGTGARKSGFVDYVALTALYTAGFPEPAKPVGGAVLDHDPIAVCRHLAAHPDAVRVTGPYPQGPLAWLMDSGCPADVVRADDWIAMPVGPEWFSGTSNEGRGYGDGYPAWAEMRRFD